MSVKNIFKSIKRAVNKVFGYFPSATPVGVAEFQKWSDSIIDTYQPAADDASVKFGLSAMLMHLSQTQSHVPKRWFAKCLHKGAAAQVGAFMLREIKEAKEAEIKAAVEAQEASARLSLVPNEATTSPEVPSNVIPLQN